ncbi:unnamed protein product [Durusdinium trenchii]|uniref:Glycosyltransferase 2-like domain-containing protein n=1 Tax=Durusdinium trenchii TaxID=1381693 RepID=A0ABP0JEF6_9DINO
MVKPKAEPLRWIRRCFLCWTAPLLFLLSAPHLESDKDVGALAVLGPLLGTFATSLTGLTATLLGCSICRVAFVQLLVQFGILLYAHGLMFSFTFESPKSALPNPVFGATSGATRFLEKRTLGTISVVLPCLNEPYAEKTVLKFCDRTPQEVLEEIIVVDDASTPPMAEKLQSVPSRCKMKILRHQESLGLMIAKQTGGDAASGTYIGFYDCHVAPAVNWYKETMDLLAAKERRLVVPMIADLDLDTWDEKVHGPLTAKCYINFNADFWWYDDESDFIPVISGGLVATTRKWWQDSGGFDPGMRGWGGENTDQSLRTWLCGGDILRAKSSHVAHMWRVDSDPRTLSRFKLKHQTDNLARVAAIWFGEFKDKFREGGLNPTINVSQAAQRIKELQCKPFVYFLHRFRKLYRGGGVLPDNVFNLRLKGSNKCIAKTGGGLHLADCKAATKLHLANMIPPGFPHPDDFEAQPDHQVVCGGHVASSCAKCPQGHGESYCHMDCRWLFGECVPRVATQMPKAEEAFMFSGIRLWNTIECFDRLDPTGPILYFCDISGHNLNQQYLLDRKGHMRHASGHCVSADESRLRSSTCEDASLWEKIDGFVPVETTRYLASVRKYGLTDDVPDS